MNTGGSIEGVHTVCPSPFIECTHEQVRARVTAATWTCTHKRIEGACTSKYMQRPGYMHMARVF